MSEDKDRKPPEEKSKRPNANYNLSKTNDNPRPEEIVYHYDRDRRLEKAPQAVQDLYYKKDEPARRGLFRPSGGRIQLFTMIIILMVCLMALVVTLIGRDGDSHEFEGNQLAVQAIRYGDLVIVALRKTVRTTRPFLNFRPAPAPYTGTVSVEVSPVPLVEQAPAAVSFQMLNFTGESPEFFRFAVPFDSDELDLVFRTENRTLSLRARVE